MQNLASPADVEARLGRPLSEAEATRTDGLLAEASAIVRAFTSLDYDEPPVPDAVIIVTSRMVARVLSRPVEREGVASAQEQYGPFMGSLTFKPEYAEGGPWLTASDKMMLGHRPSSGVSVKMASERFA